MLIKCQSIIRYDIINYVYVLGFLTFVDNLRICQFLTFDLTYASCQLFCVQINFATLDLDQLK
jgi:hypothetical protein